jgi:hypothetical protein
MDELKADQPNTPPQHPAGNEPENAAAQPVGAPADTIVKIEAPPVAAPQPAATEPAAPAPWPTLPAWLKLPRLSLPQLKMPQLKMPQLPHVTPLAATVAVAAVVGIMAGSVATAALGGLWASPPPKTDAADAPPLRDTIARINSELGTLKASIEKSGRAANAQLTRLGDRFDRLERAQAEPAARLAKLSEAVDRLEHRTPAATAPHDITGSIATPAPQPAAAAPVRPAGPPVIDGWVVRSVYNGAALIQARYGGVIEVEPGDSLPGLGRIENIRRQDGRWVVVTSRGIILAR